MSLPVDVSDADGAVAAAAAPAFLSLPSMARFLSASRITCAKLLASAE